MGYRDENNEIVGFDIDLAKEICARLGVELTLQANRLGRQGNGAFQRQHRLHLERHERYRGAPIVYDGLLDGLPEQQDRVPGPGPRHQEPRRPRRQEGGGKTSSYAEEVLERDEQYADYYKSLGEVLAYQDYLTAIMDLQNGNVQAVLIDLVVANYEITQIGDKSLFTVDNLADDYYCVGFRKEDVALRDKVNETLKAMAADGRWTDLPEVVRREHLTDRRELIREAYGLIHPG